MSNCIIRDVKPDDAKRISEIYSYYVLSTAVTYECTAPSEEEFKNRITNTIKKYPYLVCEVDNRVVGYAYANTYNPREAYDWTVTISLYLDKDIRKNGFGPALYYELEDRLRKQGIVNVLSLVAYCEIEDEYLSHDSIKFHDIIGYKKVGHLKMIGKKFDRWYDILIMHKKLCG